MSLEDHVIKLYEVEKSVAVLRTAVEKDITSLHDARVLQATEYERRLHALNGEAASLKAMQLTYLTRLEYNINHSNLEKDIKELRQYRDNSIGRQALLATIIPVIISLLFTFINLWLTKRP